MLVLENLTPTCTQKDESPMPLKLSTPFAISPQNHQLISAPTPPPNQSTYDIKTPTVHRSDIGGMKKRVKRGSLPICVISPSYPNSYSHTHPHSYSYTYIHPILIHTHLYSYTYTHSYSHTYTHTHTHTHTHSKYNFSRITWIGRRIAQSYQCADHHCTNVFIGNRATSATKCEFGLYGVNGDADRWNAGWNSIICSRTSHGSRYAGADRVRKQSTHLSHTRLVYYWYIAQLYQLLNICAIKLIIQSIIFRVFSLLPWNCSNAIHIVTKQFTLSGRCSQWMIVLLRAMIVHLRQNINCIDYQFTIVVNIVSAIGSVHFGSAEIMQTANCSEIPTSICAISNDGRS